ncbi:pitrilysin family protein [Afifella sp. IM 167]|uniref:M16 family metallopeptidase n=1 Tax=Afifella sp. IM 167 TaxID=2033586 RepID=UPI001CCD9590|nr:pitrilysin family protein [Afifella sp. IM 167]MBZ8133484.1 peptidase M16 [Afifella sp. IM 167]
MATFTVSLALDQAPAYAEDKAPAEAASAAPVAKIAPNAEEFTLSNGMDVVVIPDKRAPVVTHMVWYRVGSADEQAGQSGNAHFLEHLMFKGTKDHPEGEFSNRVSAIGGEENAFTSNDYTGYYQRVAKEYLPEMMAFEADRMSNLVLTDEVVAPERKVILEERRMRVDNDPGSLMNEALNRIFYLNHPYGRPTIGWEQEIKALNAKTALDFYHHFYTPSNAILVVAGDVTPEEVKKLAEATYGKIASKADRARPPRPAEPVSPGPRSITVRDEKVREPYMLQFYPVPSAVTAKPGEAEALSVLADILGGGATSRFYDELIRGGGKATYASAYYSPTAVDDSRFIVYGIPRDGVDLGALKSAIEASMKKIAENGVSEEELTRAKNSVVADAVYSQDSQQSLARIIGSALAVGRTLEDVQTWPARIQKVTAEDVQKVAERYLDPDKAATGYLEPEVVSGAADAPSAAAPDPAMQATSGAEMR